MRPIASSEVEARVAPLVRLARRLRWGIGAQGSAVYGQGGQRLGSAGEFEGYRPFEPGDDLRGLDVAVFARMRRAVYRVRREDSAIPLTLLVDRSASMSGELRERAVADLAALFVALAQSSGDPVRAYAFAAGEVGMFHEGIRSPAAIWRALAARTPAGSGDASRAFRRVPPDPAGRGVVVVLSDAMGLEDPGPAMQPLARLGLPFWVASWLEEELRPPLRGPVTLLPREREPPWHGTLDEAARRSYLQQVDGFQAAMRRRLRGLGGDFFLLPAETPIAEQVETIRREGRLLR